jgi:hypothetical protein
MLETTWHFPQNLLIDRSDRKGQPVNLHCRRTPSPHREASARFRRTADLWITYQTERTAGPGRLRPFVGSPTNDRNGWKAAVPVTNGEVASNQAVAPGGFSIS